MAKFCTNCGKELDDNAALCLNCGVLVEPTIKNANTNKEKIKKNGIPAWAIVLIVIMGCIILLPLILVIIIGVTFSMFVTKQTDTNFEIEDFIEETITKTGTIGSTLTTDKFKIKLTNVLMYDSIGSDEYDLNTPEEGKEYLVFFFDIENITDERQYISDFDFTGYVDEYEIYTETLFEKVDGVSELNTTLSPQKKIKGYVAFEVDKNWKKFELHYSEWFDNNELVFNVVNNKNANIGDV